MKTIITSHKLPFYLIGLLLLFILTSAIIPQKDIASREIVSWREFLGDNYIIIEKLRLDSIYYSPAFFLVLGLFGINLIAVNVKRFRTVLKLEKTLLKTRYLGSILFHFHLSLLAIIGGVILNYLYKFEGVYGITEGQTVSDSQNDYFTVFKI
jgi:cytochrome c biogenesis protein ResB